MAATRYFQAFLILTFILARTMSQPCAPGEEFKSHSLTFDVGNGTGPFSVKKETQAVTACSQLPAPSCINFDDAYEASLMKQTITLNIINVTRATDGKYVCEEKHVIVSSCEFRVYARPQIVICQVQKLQTDMLKITIVCTVTRTFPSPVCQLFWLKNGIETTLTNPPVITYKNLSVQGEPGYFYQTCIAKLTVEVLGTGSHAFRARAYPNVTGSTSDTKFGVNSDLTPSMTIGTPENSHLPSFDLILGIGLGLGTAAVIVGIVLCICCLKGSKKNRASTNNHAGAVENEGNQNTRL